MPNHADFFTEQYEWIRQSRQVLISYCQTIPAADFIKENTGFGRGGSMRNLMVHVANTYEFWIGKHALDQNITFTPFESITNPGELTELYDHVDGLMSEFIHKVARSTIQKIDYEINGAMRSVTPFQLFTHVITHEFHHKGQVLSISRQLGYTPVDTDVVR